MKKYKNFTLPLTPENSNSFINENMVDLGLTFKNQYLSALPFPHIVFDNFLKKSFIKKIISEFPSHKNQDDILFNNNYEGHNKRQINPNSLDINQRNIFNFFNSSKFLIFLENLTGIEGLIPDPHFEGGGFHEIKNKGKLGIHADFRINNKLRLCRRINLLIYLNQDWQCEYKGNFEIYDKKMKNKIHSIEPLYNRCVIFNTDEKSYHGHPEPLNLPENLSRKSIALYYYTASPSIFNEVPNHSTMYENIPSANIETRLQVLRLKSKNYAREFLPPILYRFIIKIIRKIK